MKLDEFKSLIFAKLPTRKSVSINGVGTLDLVYEYVASRSLILMRPVLPYLWRRGNAIHSSENVVCNNRNFPKPPFGVPCVLKFTQNNFLLPPVSCAITCNCNMPLSSWSM